jgi:vacuolar protein sorting-associated protein IST1
MMRGVLPLKPMMASPRAGALRDGTPKLPDIPPTEDDDEKGGSESAPSKPLDDFAMLAKRFEALKKR